MPANENILGFSNIWYVAGIENKTIKLLPDGTEIFVFPVGYYLAAKFEAFKNRGGNDLRQSHDFEDIIFILDSNVDILNEINRSNSEIKKYLRTECANLLLNTALNEGIESALPYGSGDERAEIIKELIKQIAENK